MTDSSNTQSLSVAEHIRKRPGMYLGGTDFIAAARLIGEAVDLLIGLTCCVTDAERPVIYPGHAYLHANLKGSNCSLVLDYSAEYCPDFEDRCTKLLENRDNLIVYPGARPHQPEEIVAPLPLVIALSTGLCIRSKRNKETKTIFADAQTSEVAFGPSIKGSQIAVAFAFRDQLDVVGLSKDFLHGYLTGHNRVPGLVVQSCSVAKDVRLSKARLS